MLSLESGGKEVILEMFKNYCRAAIVTREEDRMLNSAKLRSAMPPEWCFGGDILARYGAVGIELLPHSGV